MKSEQICAESRARLLVSAMTSFPGSGPPPAPTSHIASADVADARALRDAGGALLPGGDGVTVSGWEIRTRRTPILGKEALAGLEARLGTPHLPEMVYGSVLELIHAASDTRLHFNAEDALREWLEEDLPPIKVAAAAKWAEAHKLRFGGGLPPSKAAGAGAPVPSAAWDTSEDSSAYDWTFTTPYRGSVGTASGNPPDGSWKKRWAETSRRVDRQALMERDPILFFDELTLYESELDDNGESSVTVKIRVMPKCWFVLMRFWMRCDGVRVRLRETRFFCPMTLEAAKKKPIVIRESARRDESFEELRARGAPGDASQYPDADEAAAVLLAAGGPVEMAYHEIEHEE